MRIIQAIKVLTILVLTSLMISCICELSDFSDFMQEIECDEIHDQIRDELRICNVSRLGRECSNWLKVLELNLDYDRCVAQLEDDIFETENICAAQDFLIDQD